MKTKEETLQVLETAGLSHRVHDLEPLMTESIRLTSHPTDDKNIAIGASKLGGIPDLSSGFAWPIWKNIPLSFVAQLNLEQASQFDSGKVLPAHGLLTFFYDANQQHFGSDPVDRGQWKVWYFDGDVSQLRRNAAPAGLPPKALFQACTVDYSTEITLPLDLAAFEIHWSPEDRNRYSEFMATFPTPEDRKLTHHRLLGNPDQIQDDMHLQAEAESHGQKPGPVAPQARQQFNWQLLLQIDTDETVGMKWANNGMLYYWIERQALVSQRFETVWLILQSE